MKKGKTAKLTGFRTSKIHYGTVDSKEFKSLYLNIQTWVEPKTEVENWTRVVLNLTRAVKHSIYENIEKDLFDNKFIVDLDLRTSGLQLKKKSFMNLEINLYLIEDIDFKSTKLKKSLCLSITAKGTISPANTNISPIGCNGCRFKNSLLAGNSK